jgi:tryptophan 2,3-dioxygenase
LRELEVLLGLEDHQRVSLGADGGYLRALEDFDGRPSPALERVLARKADTPSLSHAVDAWLYRTPIRGSCPSSPGDADVVRKYVDDYVAACRADAGDLTALAARQTRTPEGRAALVARYEESLLGVRRFLLAEDMDLDDAAERARRSRIRAAIVFIESHRDEPLLAWPRAAIAGFVALEQAMVIFRQRHARMVEREIGRRIGTGGSAGVDYLDQTALAYRVFRDLWAARTILLRKGAVPPLDDSEHLYGFRYGG